MACLVLMMMMRNKNLLKILLKLKQHQLKTQMTPKLRAQMTLMNLQQTILSKQQKAILMMLLQTILIVKKRKIADSLVVYLTQLKKL